MRRWALLVAVLPVCCVVQDCLEFSDIINNLSAFFLIFCILMIENARSNTHLDAVLLFDLLSLYVMLLIFEVIFSFSLAVKDVCVRVFTYKVLISPFAVHTGT
jgi:hypothetical protein